MAERTVNSYYVPNEREHIYPTILEFLVKNMPLNKELSRRKLVTELASKGSLNEAEIHVAINYATKAGMLKLRHGGPDSGSFVTRIGEPYDIVSQIKDFKRNRLDASRMRRKGITQPTSTNKATPPEADQSSSGDRESIIVQLCNDMLALKTEIKEHREKITELLSENKGLREEIEYRDLQIEDLEREVESLKSAAPKVIEKGITDEERRHLRLVYGDQNSGPKVTSGGI